MPKEAGGGEEAEAEGLQPGLSVSANVSTPLIPFSGLVLKEMHKINMSSVETTILC